MKSLVILQKILHSYDDAACICICTGLQIPHSLRFIKGRNQINKRNQLVRFAKKSKLCLTRQMTSVIQLKRRLVTFPTIYILLIPYLDSRTPARLSLKKAFRPLHRLYTVGSKDIVQPTTSGSPNKTCIFLRFSINVCFLPKGSTSHMPWTLE